MSVVRADRFNNPPIAEGDAVAVLHGAFHTAAETRGVVVKTWPAHRCGPWSAMVRVGDNTVHVYADQVVGNRAYDPSFDVRVLVNRVGP